MKKYFLAVWVVLVCAGLSHAQTQTGQVFGTVNDASGAVMPGVKVTLSSTAILQPVVVTTSDAGSYQFPNIPIGMYSVKFEQTGYRPFLRENIRVDIGFNAQVNAQLAIATVEQTVEVSGAAPVIDTQSTAQAAQLDQQNLSSLPVAREAFNEVELTPGVAESAKDVGGSQNLNQPSFISRGASSGQNRYFYDGADIAPAAGGNSMWVDFGSIQEMQVTSGGADASIQTSGMSINMVTKSGSDVFHGSFHDFEEGQRFESDNIGNGALRQALAPVQPEASAGNPLTHYRDIGGEIGGPIKKGKLWFWADYGDNGIWVGADHVFQTSTDCAPVAANPLSFSYGRVRSCTFAFPTFIKAFVYKIGWQPFHNNTFTFENEYSVKQVIYNSLTPLVPLISTRPQNSACASHFQWGGLADIAPRYPGAKTGLLLWNCGWPALFRFDDQQIMSNRWVLDISFIHFAKRNQFALQNSALYDTQVKLEQSTGAITASNAAVTTYQPMNNFQIASTYSLPGKWGGNHTVKLGYNWIRFENCCTNNMGGQAESIFNSGTATPFSVPLAVNFYRYGAQDGFLREQNIYFQDTYTHKRLTLNLGVRWDHQTDSENAHDVPASPYEGQTGLNGVVFNFLPAVSFPGAQGGVAWNTFAPRLGATYDLFGTGKTVLKVSYAQYFDQRGNAQLSDTFNTVGAGTAQSFVQFNWPKDLNGDGIVQMNEVNLSTIRSFGNNYQPNNPTATTSLNSVDPNIKDPKTQEITAGVSQQVAAGFGVSVTYIYRRYSNFIWKRLNGITSANYVPCQTSPSAAVNCSVTNPNTGVTTTTSLAATPCPTTVAPTAPTQCVPVTYFVPNIPTPSAYTLANQPDYHVSYQGLEIVARKTFAKSWMFNGSFTIQSTRQYWTAPDSYQDPTNIAQQNGAQFAPSSSPGGGFPINIAVNARWNGRFGGFYRLPWWGVTFSASDDLTQGYPYLSTINVSSRANQAGSIAVLIAPPGSQRFSYVQNLAVGVKKTITIRERWKVEPSLDIYNIFNSNTILGQQPTQNSSNANYIDYVLSPRLARLGIVVSF